MRSGHFCDYNVAAKKIYSFTSGGRWSGLFPYHWVCKPQHFSTFGISVSLVTSPLHQPPHGSQGPPISPCLYLNPFLIHFGTIYPKRRRKDLKCQEGMLSRDSLTSCFVNTFLSQIIKIVQYPTLHTNGPFSHIEWYSHSIDLLFVFITIYLDYYVSFNVAWLIFPDLKCKL